MSLVKLSSGSPRLKSAVRPVDFCFTVSSRGDLFLRVQFWLSLLFFSVFGWRFAPPVWTPVVSVSLYRLRWSVFTLLCVFFHL